MRRIAFGVVLWLALSSFSLEAQAQEPIRIVALGHSAFAAKGGPTRGGISDQLEEALKAKGYNAVVANAGYWGDTTKGVLQRLDKDVPVGTRIVLLAIGGNDYVLYGTPASEIEGNIDTIVKRLRAKQVDVILFRWRPPAGKYVDDGGTIPTVERLPDRILVPDYRWRVPPELMAQGGHAMAAGNAIIVARLLPVVEEVMAKAKKGS